VRSIIAENGRLLLSTDGFLGGGGLGISACRLPFDSEQDSVNRQTWCCQREGAGTLSGQAAPYFHRKIQVQYAS
jgi:hypothetical protein